MSRRFGLVLLAAVIGLPCITPAQTTVPKHHKKKAVKQPAQPAAPTQPLPPSGPLPGFNLDQIPSSSPLVAYQSEQLTIVAQNSTLGDILRAVHTQTGAAIDMPSNSTERVVGHFGPGPAREVLASLLNGSHFDYVLLGSTANPTALDRVVLMARPIGPEAAASPAVEANATGQPGSPVPFAHPQTAAQAAQAAEDMADDSADDSADDADQADDQAQPVAQPNAPTAPKTPEELLQQLQQQQQQQQPGAAPGTPAVPGEGRRMPAVNNPEPQ